MHRSNRKANHHGQTHQSTKTRTRRIRIQSLYTQENSRCSIPTTIQNRNGKRHPRTNPTNNPRTRQRHPTNTHPTTNRPKLPHRSTRRHLPRSSHTDGKQSTNRRRQHHHIRKHTPRHHGMQHRTPTRRRRKSLPIKRSLRHNRSTHTHRHHDQVPQRKNNLPKQPVPSHDRRNLSSRKSRQTIPQSRPTLPPNASQRTQIPTTQRRGHDRRCSPIRQQPQRRPKSHNSRKTSSTRSKSRTHRSTKHRTQEKNKKRLA